MILLISPSKTMDMSPLIPKIESSQPIFQDEISTLISVLKKKKPKDFAKMMELSEKLSHDTYEKYQLFQNEFNAKNSKPAILSFTGDVYLGMDVASFSNTDLKEANNCIRILSGLYGLLKPLDLIQPYRLEMGRTMKVAKSNNLYQFWKDKIAKGILSDTSYLKDNTIINLASDEYFASVKKYLPDENIITINFKEWRNEKWSFLSYNAKRARGMMCHYIIKNKIRDVKKIKNFNYQDYQFNGELSSERNLIFTK